MFFGLFFPVTIARPYVVAGVTGGNFESEEIESMVSFVEFSELLGFDYPANVHIVEHDNHTIQGE